MDLQLKNKIALVSASTAGIGFAIGSGLAGEGATVIINGRTEQRVSQAITLLSLPRNVERPGRVAANPQIHSLRTSQTFTTCVSATYSRSVISNSGQ